MHSSPRAQDCSCTRSHCSSWQEVEGVEGGREGGAGVDGVNIDVLRYIEAESRTVIMFTYSKQTSDAVYIVAALLSLHREVRVCGLTWMMAW